MVQTMPIQVNKTNFTMTLMPVWRESSGRIEVKKK